MPNPDVGHSRLLRLMLVLAFFVATLTPRPDDGPPRWATNAVQREPGGVHFALPGMMVSDEHPEWIHQAISSDSLRLELVVETAAPAQYGPARILTISTDPGERNLTIGQEGADLIIRVRRDENTYNGTPPFVVRRAFAGADVVGLRVELSKNELTAELDGEERLRAQLPPRPFSHWNPAYPLALGNELTWDRPWLGTIFEATLTTPMGSVDLLEDGALHAPRGGPVNIAFSWISSSPVDLLLNFLLMIPIGFLWIRTSNGGFVGSMLVLWLPIVLAVELAQLMIPGRFTSVSDVLLNVLGLLVGAWLARRGVEAAQSA